LRSERIKDPQESLLLDILNGMGRLHAGAKLYEKKLAEIGAKMLFRRKVSITKALEVVLVKIEKFHSYLEESEVYRCNNRSANEAALPVLRNQCQIPAWTIIANIPSGKDLFFPEMKRFADHLHY